MKTNILVVCYNYALSRRIASILAEKFDMRSFDMYDMFKFHNAPNSLEDVIKINGEEFANKKMRGILKDELDFSGVVFVVDTKVLIKNIDLFESLKENNVVLFLKNDFKTEFAQRENLSFMSDCEKNYFALQLDELCEAEQVIERVFADIVVDISDLGYNEIIENILKGIDNFDKVC